MVLDDALVQLWKLHRICVKVILYSSTPGQYEMTEEQYRACLEELLPKATGMMESEIQVELAPNGISELPPFPYRSKWYGEQ